MHLYALVILQSFRCIHVAVIQLFAAKQHLHIGGLPEIGWGVDESSPEYGTALNKDGAPTNALHRWWLEGRYRDTAAAAQL